MNFTSMDGNNGAGQTVSNPNTYTDRNCPIYWVPPFIAVCVLGCFTLGCGTKRVVIWENLKAPTNAVVNCDSPEVNTLKINVEGRVDGVGHLVLPNGRTNLLSGNVRTNYGLDHYSTNCTVAYQPVTSTGGNLRVVITFSRY